MRLLSDPNQAKAMGAAGRALATEYFTTEAMMSRIISAYSNLLAHIPSSQRIADPVSSKYSK
jgi:glycosyltransferase involved in cell wall biosynthesis